MYLIFKISILQQKYEHITKNIYFNFYSIKVSENKQNGQMQNIQRSLVDRRSLNGLQVIRLHYITADDIEKYMTVIRESIKVIEIGLCVPNEDNSLKARISEMRWCTLRGGLDG